jgi:hypothetical protein
MCISHLTLPTCENFIKKTHVLIIVFGIHGLEPEPKHTHTENRARGRASSLFQEAVCEQVPSSLPHPRDDTFQMTRYLRPNMDSGEDNRNGLVALTHPRRDSYLIINKRFAI